MAKDDIPLKTFYGAGSTAIVMLKQMRAATVIAGLASRTRNCTVCLSRGVTREAEIVATNSEGAQWYECGQHDATDNLTGRARMTSQNIHEWYKAIGIPYPFKTSQ